MRALLLLASTALLAPAALAGHATYTDHSTVTFCNLLVRVGGIGVQVNCPGVQGTVAASEPAGGSYRLTVTWSAAGPEWSNLQADLASCDGPCQPAGSGVCLNDNCFGNPSGPARVQQAQGLGPSPLVLSIPTAGSETNVTFAIFPPGPVFASLGSQGLRVTLEHVG
jgi:hypothetical protein